VATNITFAVNEQENATNAQRDFTARYDGALLQRYYAISSSSNLKVLFWLKGALHKRATRATQRSAGLLRRIVGESCHYRLLSL
jgi:hypothetical protein